MSSPEHTPVITPTQAVLRALTGTVSRSLATATYLPETEKFLLALRDQLKWYEDVLLRFHEAGCFPEVRILSREIGQELQAEHVSNLKGLCEGTTDVIPFALASYINREFRQLRRANAPRGQQATEPRERGKTEADSPCPVKGGVALCPFRQFNYFYQDVGVSFSELFDKLNDLVKEHLEVLASRGVGVSGPPESPGTLAMIGFQYAMGRDIIFQSVLLHELGHHLFDPPRREKYRERLYEKLKASILADSSTREPLAAIFTDHYLQNNLLPWVGELFADAFAIALAGPQYALAFRDMTGPLEREKTFGNKHPADLIRRRIQWDAMVEIGWVQEVKAPSGSEASPTSPTDQREGKAEFASLAREVFSTLRPAKDKKTREWSFSYPSLEGGTETVSKEMVALLENECPRIVKDALACVKDAKERCKEFWRLGGLVARRLEKAIVPSTIVLSSRVDDVANVRMDPYLGEVMGREVCVYTPQPCTVMNAARVLYQSGCKGLRDEWSEQDDSKDSLIRVHSRLSDWALKAVSDWLLVHH